MKIDFPIQYILQSFTVKQSCHWMMLHQGSTLFLGMLLVISGMNVAADLPNPWAIEEAKNKAEEVLILRVENASQSFQASSNPCVYDYNVKAYVVNVYRSQIGLEMGDTVSFRSYTRDFESEPCQGWVGESMMPPTLLVENWCGRAYMNSIEEQDHATSTILTLGVGGKSFDTFTSAMCLEEEEDICHNGSLACNMLRLVLDALEWIRSSLQNLLSIFT